MTWRQNRTGSLSSASSDSHATGRSAGAQSARRLDLPNPAGPQTSTSSRRCLPAAAGRAGDAAPTPRRGCGARNLVASSTSWADATEGDGACDGAIVGPPQPGGSTRPCASHPRSSPRQPGNPQHGRAPVHPAGDPPLEGPPATACYATRSTSRRGLLRGGRPRGRLNGMISPFSKISPTPHAARLTAQQRPGEALDPDRAQPAQPLGLVHTRRCVREPQVGPRARHGSTSSSSIVRSSIPPVHDSDRYRSTPSGRPTKVGSLVDIPHGGGMAVPPPRPSLEDHGRSPDTRVYEIRVQGELAPRWSCWFAGLSVETPTARR